MQKKSLVSGFLFVFLFVSVVFAEVEIGGSYENDVVLGINRNGSAIAGDLNRLRLKVDSSFSSNLVLHLEPRYYLFPTSQTFALSGVSSLDQLVWDKVYLKAYLAAVDITVGKQRIALGTGYIWNPTDIFNPVVMSFTVGEEDETNVEAVRLEVPIGEAGGIDGFVLTGSEWGMTKRGIRGKGNISLFDYSLSYIDLADEGFQLGFDTAGELFGLGVRGEMVRKSPATSDAYVQSVVGCDYTFENGIYVNIEYHFNGLGKKNKDDYDWTSRRLGMDYLYLGTSKIIDEITKVGCSLLMNLDDASYLIYPSLSRNISENVDINLEAMVLGGEVGSEYYPPAAQDPTGFGGSKFGLIRVKVSF